MSREKCPTKKVDTINFMKEFEDKIKSIEGFRKVDFFGSITSPDKFCAGRSDLDVIIFSTFDKEKKEEAKRIMYELSEKYGIQTEKAVYLHPVPFFMKRDVEEKLLQTMFNKTISRLFTEKWRTTTKEAKTITLEQREKHLKKPARITRLSELLWK